MTTVGRLHSLQNLDCCAGKHHEPCAVILKYLCGFWVHLTFVFDENIGAHEYCNPSRSRSELKFKLLLCLS
jgi:hypothetical protein